MPLLNTPVTAGERDAQPVSILQGSPSDSYKRYPPAPSTGATEMKLGEYRCSDDSTKANVLARLTYRDAESNIGVAMQ
jgi:hypothetical protein